MSKDVFSTVVQVGLPKEKKIIITKCIIYLLYKYFTFINKQSILFNFESCTLFIVNRLSVKCL